MKEGLPPRFLKEMDFPFKIERLGDAGPILQPHNFDEEVDNDPPPYTRVEPTISNYPEKYPQDKENENE